MAHLNHVHPQPLRVLPLHAYVCSPLLGWLHHGLLAGHPQAPLSLHARAPIAYAYPLPHSTCTPLYAALFSDGSSMASLLATLKPPSDSASLVRWLATPAVVRALGLVSALLQHSEVHVYIHCACVCVCAYQQASPAVVRALALVKVLLQTLRCMYACVHVCIRLSACMCLLAKVNCVAHKA